MHKIYSKIGNRGKFFIPSQFSKDDCPPHSEMTLTDALCTPWWDPEVNYPPFICRKDEKSPILSVITESWAGALAILKGYFIISYRDRMLCSNCEMWKMPKM